MDSKRQQTIFCTRYLRKCRLPRIICEVHLLQYGLQLEPYEYYFTPDDFPTDFEPLILPTFNVGDQVLYREITHNTLQNVERKMATIIHVDEDDELVKYAIRDNENNVPWALAIEVEPINY